MITEFPKATFDRPRMLYQTNAWSTPVPRWESGMRREVLSLPTIGILRLPMHQAQAMGFRANHCHHNVGQFVASNPGATRVLGWIPEWPQIALHSVVRYEGRLVCITPAGINRIYSTSATVLPFIEDPELHWLRNDIFRGKRRLALPHLRRIEPDVKAMRELKRATLEGGSLDEIQDKVDHELHAAGVRACAHDPALATLFDEMRKLHPELFDPLFERFGGA